MKPLFDFQFEPLGFLALSLFGFLIQLDIDITLSGNVLNTDGIFDGLIVEIYFLLDAEVGEGVVEVDVHHEFGSLGTAERKQTE